MAKVENQVDTRTAFISPNDIVIVREKNPRKNANAGFHPEEMEKLRKGIQRDGLMHALWVRMIEGEKTRLVAGERRLRNILLLIEADKKAIETGTARVICKNPRTGKMEPAIEAYAKVECKVSDCQTDKEARRQAIQENTLHHNLSEYELLMQVDEMERDGNTRAEQADTIGVSEAWISQSHSLLSCHEKILSYMEQGKLTRTAAITFLNIPDDKVEEVLNCAINLTYKEAEEKLKLAEKVKEEAGAEVEKFSNELTVAQFTNDTETAKKARRGMARANRQLGRADKQIAASKKKTSKKITVETITTAAQEVDGASDALKRPVSNKAMREWRKNVQQLLEKDEIVNPETNDEYERKDVEMVGSFLAWYFNDSEAKSPLDLCRKKKKK